MKNFIQTRLDNPSQESLDDIKEEILKITLLQEYYKKEINSEYRLNAENVAENIEKNEEILIKLKEARQDIARYLLNNNL